jgi:hypothetical protein
VAAGLSRDHPAVSGLHLGDRVLQVVLGGQRVFHPGHLLTDVDADDAGALLGQAKRVRASLPASRSRDEGDLALDPAGQVSSSRQCCNFRYDIVSA